MTTRERELLAAARGGDGTAFRRLVEPFRGELHAHCYRMLGSVHDAEDALQDALLRAWRGLSGFAGRSTLRAWLYRIATNASLDLIARRPAARLLPPQRDGAEDPAVTAGRPLVETVWMEPYADARALEDGPPAPDARYEQRESVELAFVVALQHLPPRQRAALILRDVLGFSAKEVAEALQTTVQSVNSALQRARAAAEERLPQRSQQATLRELGDDGVRATVESLMDAMERADVGAVVAMLADDAAWSMPPLASWYRGRDGIAGWLALGPLNGEFRWRHLSAEANGQPAFGAYTWHESEGAFLPFALNVLTLDPDRRLREGTSFIARSPHVPDPSVLPRWPSTPVDPALAEAIFGRAGLPLRIAA